MSRDASGCGQFEITVQDSVNQQALISETMSRTFVYFSDAVLFFLGGGAISLFTEGPGASSSSSSTSMPLSSALSSCIANTFFLGAAFVFAAAFVVAFGLAVLAAFVALGLAAAAVFAT